ncbi:MAG: hypothetical protein AUJ98_07060 [Bacteroidetes bacterium CG2_30_33_31]|nr:MAG: hypothetical protein AUJ98_07060 [Bacteroidetes bacterium CG2_30_33_31]
MFKMRYLTIFILSILSTSLSAQLQSKWDETYGSTGNDVANSAIILNDGNYLIVGFTDSKGSGKKDGWAVKINTSGELIWDEVYGGAQDDEIMDVVEMPNGDIAFTGYTQSIGAGKSDFWLILADENGKEKWSKAYGGKQDDIASKITLGIDGKLMLSGNTKSVGAGNMDFWMIKIDQDSQGKEHGALLWKRNIGGKNADFIADVKQSIIDSTYYVLGTTTSFGNGSGDAYLIRVLEDRGMIKGNKFFGGNEYEYGNSFSFTSENGFFIVGASMSNSNGIFDGWILRLNSEFDSYYSKNFGGKKDDKFTSVIKSGNIYYVAGYTASKGEGDFDGWIMAITEQGIPIWEMTLGDLKTDKFEKILATKDGGFLLCGITTSKGKGRSDIWVVNLNK